MQSARTGNPEPQNGYKDDFRIKEYKLNPSQASSLKRFRAQEGQKELKKLKNLEQQSQLTNTQKDRMKVLEDGRFRMGFGTNSVKTLKKKIQRSYTLSIDRVLIN